jgi:sRNA-binding protein
VKEKKRKREKEGGSNSNLQKHDENVVHGQQKVSESKRESQTQRQVLHSFVQENAVTTIQEQQKQTNKHNYSSTSCLLSIISNEKIQNRK